MINFLGTLTNHFPLFVLVFIPLYPLSSVRLHCLDPKLLFLFPPLFFNLLTRSPPPPPPPSSSPPVKMSNFHPPRLCIPPEGRLSSSPLSFPFFLILSVAVRDNWHGKRNTLAQMLRRAHTPLSFCQQCQFGWKTSLTALPGFHPLPLLYVKSDPPH